MSSFHDAALLVAACAASTLAAWSTGRWWRAASAFDRALRDDESAAAVIAEVRTLRTLPARIAEAPVAEAMVLGMVGDALTRAGLNAAAAREVRSEPPVAIGNGYRRQNIRVQLEGIDVPGLGRFLDVWRRTNALWIPTTVNIARAGSQQTAERAAPKPGDWNASLVFSLTLLDASVPDAASPDAESSAPEHALSTIPTVNGKKHRP